MLAAASCVVFPEPVLKKKQQPNQHRAQRVAPCSGDERSVAFRGQLLAAPRRGYSLTQVWRSTDRPTAGKVTSSIAATPSEFVSLYGGCQAFIFTPNPRFQLDVNYQVVKVISTGKCFFFPFFFRCCCYYWLRLCFKRSGLPTVF